LGVSPTASQDAIRAAYRELAQVAHPDRGTGSADSMVQINEAYRVLADPGRRAVYDRSLASPLPSLDIDDEFPSVTPTEPKPNPLSPAGPARVPWRFMAIAAVIGSIAVLVSSFFARDPEVERPDGVLRPGSCVVFEPNGDAREVACSGAGDDVVVEMLVPLDGECPTGTVGHRDRQGLGIACVST
jgi:molecular chaperone DnaJ